jgi:protein phosphatase
MRAFSATDVGQKREINQDYIYCNENAVGALPNLFIVADGMGGHNAGDFASRFCVENMVEALQVSSEKTIIGMIENAITETNEKLILRSKEKEDLEGMGTTLVLATILEHIMYVANIGDSRLYLINDTIKQITQDHSLVEEMVKTGELKKEEARFHPKKNIITRAIGANNKVIPDFFEISVKEDDIILLCSDGLSNMLEDQELYQIVHQYKDDLKKAVEVLLQRANECGGKDNIAVVLVQPL